MLSRRLGNLEQQPVAREVASPTAVETEVRTPEPIAEVYEEVEEVEEIVEGAPPDTFALTATALISRLTESAAAEDVAEATQPADGGAEHELSSESGEAVATEVPLVRETVPPGEDCIHEIRAGGHCSCYPWHMDRLWLRSRKQAK